MIETVRKDIADIIGIDICSIKSNVTYVVLPTIIIYLGAILVIIYLRKRKRK